MVYSKITMAGEKINPDPVDRKELRGLTGKDRDLLTEELRARLGSLLDQTEIDSVPLGEIVANAPILRRGTYPGDVISADAIDKGKRPYQRIHLRLFHLSHPHSKKPEEDEVQLHLCTSLSNRGISPLLAMSWLGEKYQPLDKLDTNFCFRGVAFSIRPGDKVAVPHYFKDNTPFEPRQPQVQFQSHKLHEGPSGVKLFTVYYSGFPSASNTSNTNEVTVPTQLPSPQLSVKS